MKGHSERVPNKNLRDFCGRPLFHRVVSALVESGRVTEVIIDTDSPEIAASAAAFPQVRTVDRPRELRGDFVPMNDILAHDISALPGEHFLQTHSTNPLLSSETVARAIDAYFASLDEYDSLFSVTRLQTRLYDSQGRPLNHDPSELIRTQDLEPLWEENSNIYIFSKDSFAASGGNRIGAAPKLFEMDALEAVDIDEERDFVLAEALFANRQA